ncbi:permease [Paramaledivibacter caminithermalis]|jgi:uncharacterized membrane protein YraQ (UPF0718 family)|uniref:Predicted permease n=1 Tax=Paramaledivibacter caminithermalis (strain DSM 15212 / CIP 107654 / DViRD3) TaxID=1121301 RepID=A0A1M6LX84_PARC5|nr:permease [Paramaledivibacter caminithermalis]SHJ75755.1 Predicted permease [Paramaledivibacter caminithermalis DSM 15212]
MRHIKRYKFFIITIIVMIILNLNSGNLGVKAIQNVGFSMKEMILIIPPVFVLLGLLDVWVPREIMMKYMGEGSGIKGVILAFILGSAAAGPLYGAFPIAAIFMKKGVKLSNIFIFIGAWSTTKIPMFLFEMTSLGMKFATTRLLVNVIGIMLIAYILDLVTSEEEAIELYRKAESN